MWLVVARKLDGLDNPEWVGRTAGDVAEMRKALPKKLNRLRSGLDPRQIAECDGRWLVQPQRLTEFPPRAGTLAAFAGTRTATSRSPPRTSISAGSVTVGSSGSVALRSMAFQAGQSARMPATVPG